jgi:hypothetical protein
MHRRSMRLRRPSKVSEKALTIHIISKDIGVVVSTTD